MTQPLITTGGYSAPVKGVSSYHHLCLIEDALRIGTWSWNLDTGGVTWSAGMYRLLGLDQRRVDPSLDLLMELIHPDDRHDEHEERHRLARAGGTFSRRFRIVRPDGSLRLIVNAGETIVGSSAQPAFVVGFMRDVGGEEEALGALDCSERRLDALRRVTAQATWSAGPDGRIIDAPAWRALSGQPPEAVAGLGWIDALHADDRLPVMALFADPASAQAPELPPVRIVQAGGRVTWITLRAAPIRDRQGVLREWVVAAQVLERAPATYAEREPRLHGAQLRAARALLNWSINELADASGVSVSTIRRVEATDGPARSIRAETLAELRTALDRAGVLLTSAPPGVSLTR